MRKLEQAIDAIVDQVDPGALRRSRKTACQRDVEFGSPSDEAGFTSMWARLYAPDAAVLQQRFEEMARGVCEDDPRALGERRSDALTALATGSTQLACACGSPDCPAATRETVPLTPAVIHLVAHADTVDAARTDTTTPPLDPTPDADDEPAAATESGHVPPAFVIGGGVLPAPLLAATLGRATVREIRHPGDAPPEPHYRPSRDLADFVRCRDLTCRWPGCDKPAYGCDIDHTVPYPIGPTHASNTKCYCRFHRMHKRLLQAKCVSPKLTSTKRRRRTGAIHRALL